MYILLTKAHEIVGLYQSRAEALRDASSSSLRDLMLAAIGDFEVLTPTGKDGESATK